MAVFGASSHAVGYVRIAWNPGTYACSHAHGPLCSQGVFSACIRGPLGSPYRRRSGDAARIAFGTEEAPKTATQPPSAARQANHVSEAIFDQVVTCARPAVACLDAQKFVPLHPGWLSLVRLA